LGTLVGGFRLVFDWSPAWSAGIASVGEIGHWRIQPARRIYSEHREVENHEAGVKLHLDHAPIEIERKFLVATDDWKRSVVRSIRIRDGLIAVYKGRKVRVRIAGDVATITIKGPRSGLGRAEYEYEIPLSDGEHMLSIFCRDDHLEKQRFFVQTPGAVWHVDVYEGLLEGVVIAEIELTQELQKVELPTWIGKEVTGDLSYRKINMLAQRQGGAR
jgi:adenylate cyclase